MSFSSFSGPIRTGTVNWTTGSTPGTVSNTGLVVLSQSFTVDAALLNSGATNPLAFMLPAYSQILSISMDTPVAFTFTGGTTAVDVALGATTSTANFAAATNVTSIGSVPFPTLPAAWLNVNVVSGTTTDVPVYANITYIGGAPATVPTGLAQVTLTYVQKGPYGNQRPLQS